MGAVTVGLWTSGSGGRGAVAVATARGDVRARSCGVGRRASEELLPALDALLAEVGASPRDVVAVAAASGPGSFTGIRVGLAALEGLGRAVGARRAAIPSLRLMAGLVEPSAVERVVAVLPAGRGEVFAGAYAVAGSTLEEEPGSPHLIAEADLVAFAAGAPLVVEAGWRAPAGALVAGSCGPEECARAAAQLAGSWVSGPGASGALYVRQSWAEEVARDGR